MVDVALIGLGLVAENIHIPACKLVPELRVTAACDPDQGRRQRFSNDVERVYPGIEELFAKENPEIVIVGTPPSTHAELCRFALERGADVLCEKPFAVSVEEADQIIETARHNKRALAINTQYRYMSFYESALEEIGKQTYGQPYLIQGWQQMFHPACDDRLLWRSQLKRSTLFDFGSHPIDLACRLFGSLPEFVTAFAPRVLEEYDSDVVMHVVLNFPNQRMATFTFNRVSQAPERYFEMRVDCREASLRLSLGGVARASLDMVRHKERLAPRLRMALVKGGETRVERQGKSELLAVEAKPAFAKATAKLIRQFLSRRKDSDFDYQDVEFSRDVLNVIFAAYRSAELGAPVKIERHSTLLSST